MADRAKYIIPIRLGALFGALLTPAFMTLLFVGERLANLPFLPFDLFNWIARILPGAVITFGIDRMVDILILAGWGADLDSAAKTSEQMMALGTFWIIGILSGAVFFLALNRFKPRPENYLPGIILGLALGAPLAIISLSVNISSAAPDYLQLVWHALVFVGFGNVFSWVYDASGASPASSESGVSAAVIDRRQFIVRMGGATAALTVVGAGLAEFLSSSDSSTPASGGDVSAVTTDSSGQPLPNAGSPVEPAPGTRPELTPVEDHYRIDILAGGLPTIAADYTLPITGLVANELRWTLDEIRAMPSVDAFITMSCISNRIGGSLIGTTRWTGVSFQHILEQIQPTADAAALRIEGADGFDEYIALDLIRQDDRIMLAYAFDGDPLPLKNGYPLRTHIPNRYGMKQPKWITRIEVVASHEPGYWVRRGWSRDALVNTTSVVDTVATENIYTDDEGRMLIPVGGIAWAGDRGIAKVEVSVDEGEWQQAELRDPISDRTWAIWRYDWPFAEGEHTFQVRCYEKALDGQSDSILQPTSERGTRPDGATGIHQVEAFVPPLSSQTAQG